METSRRTSSSEAMPSRKAPLMFASSVASGKPPRGAVTHSLTPLAQQRARRAAEGDQRDVHARLSAP